MGSSLPPPSAPAPEFLAAFRERLGTARALPFAAFMELALYHPTLGYYRRPGPRIGYEPGTDFFTASTSGPIFGELIAAACVQLLGGRPPGGFDFIELGAEQEGGVLQGVAHPFRSVRCVRVGEPIRLEGACVVFSNELFDAQPFRRLVFHGGKWRELAVREEAGRLVEVEFDPNAGEGDGSLPGQPAGPEPYHFDAPDAARRLMEEIARQPWNGLLVAVDYGKSLRELLDATPQGTARAYFRHTQSNDLLARPGEQDLTCHVCWDWLQDALAAGGFRGIAVESQEAFLVRHAAGLLAEVSRAEARQFSARKLALMQLLHPAHLGQKFQVLHALR